MWKANREYQKNYLDVIAHAAALFIIGGVIGFIIETLFWHYALGFCWFKTGFLRRIPLLPIYGTIIGGTYLFIAPIDKFVEKIDDGKILGFINRSLFYFMIFFVASFVVEVITGSFFYNVFDEVRLWDYLHEPNNYKGFATPYYSFLFGFGGVILLNTVYYPFDNLVVKIESHKISRTILRVVTVLFLLAIIIDIPPSIDYWETGAYPWKGNTGRNC